MEAYLMITQINDFIFCPRSMFFSGIFRNTADQRTYHQVPQIVGLANHKTVDDGTYSSNKNIITGLTVYSEKYNLLGKIDILDTDSGLLTERKYSVTAVYDGFKYQLYAQYFALTEMGFHVHRMRLHSVKDNRNYDVPIPDENEVAAFENTLRRIREYAIDTPFTPNTNKCMHCIYNPLCDYGFETNEKGEPEK